MQYRHLLPKDIPILRELAEQTGFPYPDLESDPHIEAVVVVVDRDDRPLMACAAKKMVELYLFVDSDCSPTIKMDCIQVLHHAMAESLRALKYNECNVQLPPVLATRFGKRLRRTFGWAQNVWENWFIRF